MAASRAARLTEPDDDGVQDIIDAGEAQEREAEGEYVSVAVADIKVRLKPQLQWRMSHIRALNKGDLDTWAEGVIHPDDLDEFFEADVTVKQFSQFAEDSSKATGDDLGKSSGPSRSSKISRRR